MAGNEIDVMRSITYASGYEVDMFGRYSCLKASIGFMWAARLAG